MKQRYRKSFVGARFLAGLIDYTIISFFSFYLIYEFGEPNEEGGYTLSGLRALILTPFWFIITIGLEQLFGSTLGNGIMALKPVDENDNSKKPTILQSLKRHLLDPVDMFFFGLVGFITIKNTEKHQRVGDIWAKTIVVDSNEIFKDE